MTLLALLAAFLAGASTTLRIALRVARVRNLVVVNADEPVRVEVEPVLELSPHALAILARDVEDLANDVLGGWDLNLAYQEKGGTIVFPLSEENIRSYERKKVAERLEAKERASSTEERLHDEIYKAFLERKLNPPKLLQPPRTEPRCSNCGWLK